MLGGEAMDTITKSGVASLELFEKLCSIHSSIAIALFFPFPRPFTLTLSQARLRPAVAVLTIVRLGFHFIPLLLRCAYLQMLFKRVFEDCVCRV
jgi:hypothetical protein